MSAPDDRTVPSRQTRDEEQREARTPAGTVPTSEEGDKAKPPADVDDDVRENYEEMIERGANQKGEGRVD
jgi:hypothetical protein